MTDIEPAKIKALVDRAAREIDAGLLPSCQLAIGYEGEVVAAEALGEAGPDSRFVIFSSTKALVAAAVWRLMAQGLIDTDRHVVDYVPEFGTNGKDGVTVEQVMLHTSGFPFAPLGPPQWETSAGRREAFARWRLNFEPGTRYVYHPTSAHWVLAEIIQAVTGKDFRDVVEEQVTAPLGLPRLLGIPEGPAQEGILDVVACGEPVSAEELEAVGLPDLSKLMGPDVTTENLLLMSLPDRRAVGLPGGGGVARAVDLVRFYQALLHNPGEHWPSDLLADVTGRVRNTMPDFLGVPANRSLGLILAGDDGKSNMRGLGRTASPGAFGHNGAGGQIAFADPATGLSFAYLTNGLDQHLIRQARRDTAIASLAASLLD